ncbi:sulfurtransferase [Stappia sp. ES.058]|uniref:sulfurtransferase n=1 Tax=Stappia sp. ES.058 TaxID=1881061 RepID=UPI00087CE602|nr:sulfurtransferase [Stappia sp. ES.058]SDU04733.1 thiosulfate/3-mercaptopyruvate sulfurtransferase [Stappia sp. ES.058]
MLRLNRIAALIGLTLSLGFAPVAIAAPEVTPLVSTQWLADNLDRDDVLVVDIRSPFAKSGREDYLKAHIPDAVWSEYPGYWRTDRDSIVGVLPSVEKLEAALSELGVSDTKTVVIVPAGTTSSEFGAAARIYWTLKYLGHDAVAILDGGHAAWISENRPVESGNVVPTGDMFIAEPREAYLVQTSDVAAKLNSSAVLVDGRPASQFSGKEKHSKATRFGRIPDAVGLDQAVFYDEEKGRLKDRSEIAGLVSPELADRSVEMVSYCNTGHWAATNWFVLHEVLGYENVSLYDESMVGWSQDESLPMASERTTFDDIKAFFSGILG